MSRRVILLATLSLAAVFIASVVLLQGRSDFARPLFPKPWNSESGDSWLKEHIDGLVGSHKPSDSTDTDAPLDPTKKPPSSALADPEDNKSEGEVEQKPAADDAKAGGNGEKGGSKAVGGEAELDDAKSGPLNATIIETQGFHDEVIDVWMLEVGGSHDEVLAALINSFGAQRNVQVSLYQRFQRFGIDKIFDQFDLARPMPPMIHKTKFTDFKDDHIPRILVSTTCELDAMEMDKQFTELMEKEQTYLFCVVHHADRWVNNKSQRIIQPWVKKGLVDFICLSKHTQDFLDRELQKWDLGGVKPSTRHFVPVFPVDMSEVDVKLEENELSFALQGNYDASRRDYNKIFDHLGKFLKEGTYSDKEVDLDDHESHPDIQLHLLGNGKKPEVPEELVPHVKFDENLDYLAFYSIISRSFAILPGFANNEYLDRKASSTVPASLIAGTPLVATQKILDAYTYLPAEAVWLQADDEEDFAVIGRILTMKPEERKKKKEAVIRANKNRVEMNKGLTAEWIREGLAKIRKLNSNEDEAAVAEKDTPAGLGGKTKTDPEVMEGVGSKKEDVDEEEDKSGRLRRS